MEIKKTLKTLKNQLRNNQNFIIYGVIGVTGVGIDFITFNLMVYSLGFQILIANIISVSFGITNNFLLNTFFNFKKTDLLLKRFFSFYSIGILGLIISSIILFSFSTVLGFNVVLVKLFSIIFVVVVQYNLNKKITFEKIGQKK